MNNPFEFLADKRSGKRGSRWGKIVLGVCAVGAALAASCGPLHAQSKLVVTDKTRAQFAALEKERAERTPTEKKLDTQLVFASREEKTGVAVSSVPTLHSALAREADGRVKVRIRADVSDDLLDAIKTQGGTVTGSYPAYRVVYATLRVGSLHILAGRPDVQFIDLPPQIFTYTQKATAEEKAFTDSVRGFIPQPAEVDTATNDPEGDATHGAAAVRQQYGINGTGIKVGVISNSIDDKYGSYATAVQNGYVPNNITVLSGQAGSSTDDGEGLAMLEVVHRIAPGATLYYATATNGIEQTAENIKTMAADGCKIILDDIGFGVEDPFQDDTVSLAIDAVTAQGVLYFSSAANNYNIDSGYSSCWEGNFVSTNNDGFLDFAAGGSVGLQELNGTATFNTGTTLTVVLYFAEPLNDATSQYNVYELDSSGNTVHEADNPVAQTKANYQGLTGFTPGNYVGVQLASGSARFLHLNINDQFSYLEYATQGRVTGHNGGADTLSCAATPAYKPQPNVPYTGPTGPYPNLFNASNKVEIFSDDGPRRIFFNPDGSAITAGNFTATGGKLLLKPDFTAADGVTTSVPEVGGSVSGPFFGTSCAAPHAGALAALAWSGKPSATAAQVEAALKAGCVEITAHGVNDRDSGAGILLAANIVKALGVSSGGTAPTITSFTPTSGPVGTNVTINGTNLSSITDVYFNGTVVASGTLVSATQITAVVPTGATTGPIKIVTPSGTVTSTATFTVTTGTAPTITSFTPTSGPVGTTVTINGTNFSTATDVYFNQTDIVTGTIVSNTQLSVVVPAGATTGLITVFLADGSYVSSKTNFTVTTGGSTVPTITNFTPTSGPVGTTVTVNGTNLSTITDAYFNGTEVVTGKVISDTQITAVVPTGATTGKIEIVTSSGTVTSTGTFTVTTAAKVPVVTSATTATATQGAAFSYQITATNSPTSYGVQGLPSGVSVNTKTGLISGKFPGAGSVKLTINVYNAAGKGTATLTVTVKAAPPVITSATTTSGKVGTAFSFQITATNSPTSYGVQGLTDGLSVNTKTGLISGTPTGAGTLTLTVNVYNAAGKTTGSLKVTITAAAAAVPVITSATTATAKKGQAFSYQITATNSPTSYGVQGLADGFSVSKTGLITGTPTTAETVKMTLNVYNAAGKGTGTLTVTVSSGAFGGVDEADTVKLDTPTGN